MSQLFSDHQGNHQFFLDAAGAASIEFHSDHCLLAINSDQVYRLDHTQLKRLLIQSGKPPAYRPSPHLDKIDALMQELGIEQGFCVDIGAYDGLNHSNVLRLIEAGWSGLLIEPEVNRFASLAQRYRVYPRVQLSRSCVTPENVLPLLQAHGTPRDFDFLSLDIDSYDHDVLEALLTRYRPAVILSEINEVIPPPLAFKVHYHPDYEFQLEKRFYGQSLAQLHQLAERLDYQILDMYYMDVFLIDKRFTDGQAPSLQEIYQQGLRDRPRPDYYANYPFDVDAVLQASPERAIELIQAGFAEFEGQFSLKNLEL